MDHQLVPGTAFCDLTVVVVEQLANCNIYEGSVAFVVRSVGMEGKHEALDQQHRMLVPAPQFQALTFECGDVLDINGTSQC